MSKTNDIGAQANPYMLVFESLFYRDTSLSKDIKYIALDLTNALVQDQESLLQAMQNFCQSNGYTLLQDTLQTLTEKGFIEERRSRFTQGVLIVFEDKELNDHTLITSSYIYRDGLAARGVDFTVKRGNHLWEITSAVNEWVS